MTRFNFALRLNGAMRAYSPKGTPFKSPIHSVSAELIEYTFNVSAVNYSVKRYPNKKCSTWTKQPLVTNYDYPFNMNRRVMRMCRVINFFIIQQITFNNHKSEVYVTVKERSIT